MESVESVAVGAGEMASGVTTTMEESRPSPPPRALGISLLSLFAAGVIGIFWPESVEQYSGFVWILALIPLFLLSYYRGWQGAAVAALTAMVALVGVEVIVIELMGRQVDWWMLGGVTVLLIMVTFGAGSLSELLHRQRRLALHMAYEDPLTRLSNRRLLQELAEKALAAVDREGGKVGMIFLDLVRFKRINDHLGHRAGDEVLVRLAERLKDSLREADTVARVGGDEFAVLLSDGAGRSEALAVARRVREQVSLPFQVNGQTVHLGARIGLAMYPEHASDFDELLSKADPGKQGGKRSGGDGISVYDPDEGSEYGSELAVEEELRKAVERDRGLTLHYQPVATVPDRKVVGAEGFLRWEHPEWGTLSAGKFIGIAEYTGLIQVVKRRVLQEAVAQARRWADSGGPGWVSVNMSPISLEDPDTVAEIRRLLEEHDVDGERLVLEMTERATIRNPDAVADVITQLKDLGVQIAIDDFGTGHASLTYLERFSAEFLKVDTVFVARLGSDRQQERLVEGIIGLGRGLEMSVIVEGVETREQYEWLRGTRCDLFQGHFTGRPVPAVEMAHPAATDSEPTPPPTATAGE